MGAHLTGWRLSAGDEHTVFDGQQSKIATIACGGMSGRTFAESAEVARLIAASPELLEALQGVMDILGRAESNASGNPEWDYVGPRVAAARAAIAKATQP